MTSHRPEDVPTSVRVTMHRDEPDEELPPLLYYTTCIARSSDPTTWAKHRGSDYWLDPWGHQPLLVGSALEPEPEPEVESELVDNLSNVIQHGWGHAGWSRKPVVISYADFPETFPILHYIDVAPAPLSIMQKPHPDEYTPMRAIEVSPPRPTPTPVIPVIQPGDSNLPTQVLPILPPVVGLQLFTAKDLEIIAPPDLESILTRNRPPLGGST